MGAVRQALKIQNEAQRRRALAPAHDPVRREFELGLADRLDEEAQALLTPPEPLKTGLGAEIVPRMEDGLPGLESVLQEADLLNAEASQQRMHLLERTKCLEIGLEAAQQGQASNAIERMLCHQMAAAHRRAMMLLAEAEQSKDAQVACLKTKTASRLMAAFSQAALVLQRLQNKAAGHQIQQVNVAGDAVVGQITGR